MRQQLARHHNAAGQLHELHYDPNHPLGPGLTIDGPTTDRPGYIGMTGDSWPSARPAAGRTPVARLEISGTGTVRAATDAALLLGSSSRQWLEGYFSGGIFQGGISMLTGSDRRKASLVQVRPQPPLRWAPIYRRTNGALSTALYVKGSGSGNTGWAAVEATSRA